MKKITILFLSLILLTSCGKWPEQERKKLINKCIKAGSGAGDGTAADSSSALLKLKIADGSANGRFITFSTLITGISMNSAVGEVLSADISWESNGAPTEVSI